VDAWAARHADAQSDRYAAADACPDRHPDVDAHPDRHPDDSPLTHAASRDDL
jgi:hypothetical protein